MEYLQKIEQENGSASKYLESEVYRLREIDAKLMKSIDESQLGSFIFYPAIVCFIIFILIAKFTDYLNKDLGESFFLLSILLLFVLLNKVRIYRNLTIFNESKVRLERSELCLTRCKVKHHFNPTVNLVRVCPKDSADMSLFIVFEMGNLNLKKYKGYLQHN